MSTTEQKVEEFSQEEKARLTQLAKEKLEIGLKEADNSISRTMCESEYYADLNKIEKNINPFNLKKPDTSEFECIGCSA